MKLLIITQKVDKNDPILGFFYNWLLKLSDKYESLYVICLEEGVHELPANVKVFSLGKNHNLYFVLHNSIGKKIAYTLRFWKLIWELKNQYDAVFVHMNQEYVLLGWKLWKLLGKRIYLWRNHKKGSFFTRVAVWVSNKVFCTSKDSFTARFKKTILMPVGIDTDLFTPHTSYSVIHNSILFLGRIAPVKNLDLFLEALKILKEKEVTFEAHVYGDVLPRDEDYFQNLNYKNLAQFHPGVPNYETPRIYGSHQLYVNLTPSGSFDKTILEAAASGCIPVIVNKSLEQHSEFSYLITELKADEVADAIALWFKADATTREEKSKELREFVVQNHSLNLLVSKLKEVMTL